MRTFLVGLLILAGTSGNAFAQNFYEFFERAYPHVTLDRGVSLRPLIGDMMIGVQQTGELVTFGPASNQTKQVILDISDELLSIPDFIESGLLSVAVHPDFSENGYIYIYYSTGDDLSDPNPGGLISLDRYTLNTTTLQVIDGSRTSFLSFLSPSPYHNGGDMHFGPHDGYLYVTIGDGICCADPFGHGQDLGNLHGKMIRIDVDNPENGNPYGIPSDNPFLDNPEALPELYAIGLRNPWRFSFDSETHDLYVGDVGEIGYEEVNLVKPGGNYGWGLTEGPGCLEYPPGNVVDCDYDEYDPPLWYYDHDIGRSVTGGYVYRGNRHEPLVGSYIVGDWADLKMWALTIEDEEVTSVTPLSEEGGNFYSGFGYDASNEIYVISYFNGHLYQLKVASNSEPEPPSETSEIVFILDGPNPVLTSTAVKVSGLEGEQISIELYDVLGRLVSTVYDGVSISDHEQHSVNLQGISVGVYLLTLRQNGHVVETIRITRI